MVRAAMKADSARAIREAAQRLKILGDPTRLCILGAIANGSQTVRELAILFGTSDPATNQRLSLLHMARFVEKRRDGQRVIYTLTDLGRAFWDLAEKLIS